MSQAIRIALIVAAVASLIAGVATLVPNVINTLRPAIILFDQSLPFILDAALWARRLINALFGNVSLANAVISLIIIMPFTYFVTSIVTRVYRLIIGN